MVHWMSLRIMRAVITGIQYRAHCYIFGTFDWAGLPLDHFCQLIWDKGLCGMGDIEQPWGLQHEPITFAIYESSKQHRIDGRGKLSVRLRKGSVLRVPRLNGISNQHPTEKPVLLLRQLIESSSVIGDLVLDSVYGRWLNARCRSYRRAQGNRNRDRRTLLRSCCQEIESAGIRFHRNREIELWNFQRVT